MLYLIAAIVIAGFAGSVTDWLFMGVLFKQDYDRYPEIWWPGIREGKEGHAIMLSTAMGFAMSAALIALCDVAGVSSIKGGAAVALLAWIAGPLGVCVMNGLFIKFAPRITFAHATGYLVRLLIAGVAAGIALPLAGV